MDAPFLLVSFEEYFLIVGPHGGKIHDHHLYDAIAHDFLCWRWKNTGVVVASPRPETSFPAHSTICAKAEMPADFFSCV